MLYDTAIIGAGADGLAAAAHLARAGATVVVIERAERCGGRLQTRQFRPGFFASPFADLVAEIPPAILQTLGDVSLRAGRLAPEGVRLRHRAAVDHLLGLAATPHRQNFLAPAAAPWSTASRALAGQRPGDRQAGVLGWRRRDAGTGAGSAAGRQCPAASDPAASRACHRRPGRSGRGLRGSRQRRGVAPGAGGQRSPDRAGPGSWAWLWRMAAGSQRKP